MLLEYCIRLLAVLCHSHFFHILEEFLRVTMPKREKHSLEEGVKRVVAGDGTPNIDLVD